MRDYAPRLRAQRERQEMMTFRIKAVGALLIFAIALAASFVIVITPANVILRGVLLLVFDGLAGWFIFRLVSS